MNSPRKTPENPTIIAISQEEGEILRQILGDVLTEWNQINKLDSLEVSRFLDNLKIIPIGAGSKLSEETRKRWNMWIDYSKSVCIPTIRSNAINLPYFKNSHIEKCKIFMDTLLKILPEYPWETFPLMGIIQQRYQTIMMPIESRK